MGLGALSLPGLLGEASATGPHFAPRARRVIHIFANGGPSQVDTFDPKAELKRLDGEPLPEGNYKTERKTGVVMASPFKFAPRGQCGTEVSELFEKTAEHIDDIAVIRSMIARRAQSRTVADADEHRRRPVGPAVDGIVVDLRARLGQ